MVDKVYIFNLTLIKLKKERITNPAQSIELSDIYEGQRDVVLRAHPWNFATVRTSLARETSTTDWRYANSYKLPTDPLCLRVLGLENNAAKWEVVYNRRLVTDEGDPLKIKFIAQVTDESLFSPEFADVLATKMAFEAGPKIAGISAAQRDLLWKEYVAKTTTGRSADGQEGNFLEVIADDYLDSRL